MAGFLTGFLILLVLAFWLVWALRRIRRRKRLGKGCGSCSADCPYHDQCK